MALDPNIALQTKLPTFDSPLTQYAQVSAIQNAQNQNQLAQYTISKAQRGDADELAIRNLLTGAGGDLEAGKNALYKGGFYKQAQEMGKSQLEQDKAKSEIGKNNAAAGKSNQETSAAKRTQAIQDMTSFETPADALASLQHHAQQGSIDPQQAQLMAKNIPTDPAQFAQWQMGMLRKLMAPKDQVALTTPDANAQLSAQTSRSNNAANVGATVRGQDMSQGTAIRGQNLADSRSREANANGKVPTGYRANADGSLSFIPGGPADPAAKASGPATEDERKAAGWVSQAENAYKNMLGVMFEKDGKTLSKSTSPGTLENSAQSLGLGQAANWLRSPDRQKFVQGSSSLSEALLRAATGAGVNKDEAKQKIEELTPVYGDSDAVREQKLAAIPVFIESLKQRAGRALPKDIDLTKVKPGTGDFETVMADARRIGELRNKPRQTPTADGSPKPSLDDIFGK